MNEIDWLEKQCTLHQRVEIIYVVDGYEVQVLEDDERVSKSYYGETLQEALRAAINGSADSATETQP